MAKRHEMAFVTLVEPTGLTYVGLVCGTELAYAFTHNQLEVARQRARKLSTTKTERDVVFDCPACDHEMVTDKAGCGRHTYCPRCGQHVIIPYPVVMAPSQVKVPGAL